MNDFGIREQALTEIKQIAKECKVDKVLIFGSRARGDYKRTSDIDLAVKGGDVVKFTLKMEETSTLLEFDVVDLDGSITQELYSSIMAEGKVIYEKVENFYHSLENLKTIYDYDESYEDVVLTGLVTYYSLCFEQAWKAMKEILEDQGFPEGKTGSPKQVIKTAFKADMIKDEECWLEALTYRNNVARAYNKDIAQDIVAQAKNKFCKMFCELKEEMEKNWVQG